jgi:hypothetical protein
MKRHIMMMGMGILIMLLAMPFAIAAPLIQNVEITTVTDTSATISWQTNENATSRINYGINNFNSAQQNPLLELNHTISLQSLQRNMSYNVSLVSCNAVGECASFNTSFVSLKDTDAPPINVDIPAFVNRRAIDIRGSTEQFSEVYLYVNNFNVPARVLGRQDTGATGKIEFRNVILQDQNSIRILMKDSAGNLNERLYDVRVDLDKPILVLQPTSAVTSVTNFTLSGTVNEFVTLKLFVRRAAETVSPTKTIQNFRNQSIGENMVTLAWDAVDDKDFSHYILRRQDVGPIALMHPSSYTTYTDILVDAGRDYSYTLSYMNRFGLESPQTNVTTVKIPQQELVFGLRPIVVDINADFSTPTVQTNASGAFSVSALLNAEDGSYVVKLEATDKAGNIFTIERSVEKDTKKPDIQLLSPPASALIFENYANEVDVEGITEPGAKVHLYLNRAPFQCNISAWSVPRLLDDLKNIPDSELTATTSRTGSSVSFCPLTADKSTTADSEGRFRFEDVDLFASFGLGVSITQIPLEQFTSGSTAVQNTKRTRMVLIATDKAGLKGALTSEVTVGNCWSGNVTWDVIPLAEFQTPTLLSTERLAENTESIYFYFNYSYIGRGSNPKITSVSLQKACGTVEVLDKRFNLSCRLLPGGGNAQLLNPPENSISYSAIPLSRVENMDRWLEGDWKQFFKAINNELTFPFKVTITYTHDVQGRKVTETQTTCQEVTYVLDNSRIDPRKVLPDWLLYDFVDFLNASIHTIREVQERIDLILPYIATACSASYMASFGTSTWRHWQEAFTENKIKVKQLVKKVEGQLPFEINFGEVSFGEHQQYCNALVEAFVKSPKYGNGLNFKLSWLSDADLKMCFPDIAAAWEYEATTYQAYRYACDRLFGHVSPAGWTETKSDKTLVAKSQQANSCPSDQSVRGLPKRADKCESILASGRYPGYSPSLFKPGANCIEIETVGERTLYQIEETVGGSSTLHRLSTPVPTKVASKLEYAVKATGQNSENNYLLPQQVNCNEVCTGIKSQNLPGGTPLLEGTADISTLSTSAVNNKRGVCTTTQRCLNFNKPGQKEVVPRLNPQKGQQPFFYVDKAERRGYTQDCFYDGKTGPLSRPSSVNDNNAQRYECCCLYEQGATQATYSYYEINDGYLDSGVFYGDESNLLAVTPSHIQDIPSIHKKAETEIEAGEYTPIEWSYRYSKIKFRAGVGGIEHTEYNPYRYIEGRDFPACFGQNMWFQEDETILMLDPARQHVATFQCANVGGIQQRLTMITNIMSAMQTCLIQVRTTGRGDTGACKELFTQHVCGLTWDAIQWFIHLKDGNCASGNVDGPSGDINQDSFIEYVRTGTKGIMSALSEQQSQFVSEYGNIKTNSAFGLGAQETARKICLAAFGYEWPFSAKSLLDLSYAQPFATLVQPITASRDLLSVDPKTGQAMIEYRASWLINPGCDFSNYKVELACIGRDTLDRQGNTWDGRSPLENGADCTKQRSPDGINCPCLDSGEKVQSFFSSTTKLKQNVLEEKADHKVIASPYRYDHIKVTLLPDAKVDPKLRSRCFPEGREQGVYYFPITDRTIRDVLNCRIEPLSGVLMCNTGAGFIGQKGFAYFNELFIGDDPVKDGMQVLTGKPLTLRGTIFKSGGEKCLIATVTRPFVRTYLLSQILQNGTWPFGPVNVGETLTLSTRQQVTHASNKVTATLIQSTILTGSVSIQADFYNEDQNAQLDSNSNDYIIIEGKRYPAYSSQNDQFLSTDGKTVTVQMDSSSIKITKDGQTIQVTGMSFEKANVISGDRYEKVLRGPFTIFPSTEATSETQQTMTLTLTLNNFKGGATPTGNINDCNLNEIATSPEGVEQKRVYNLQLVNTGSVSLEPQLTGRIEPTTLTSSARYIVGARTSSSDVTIKQVISILVRGPEGEYTDAYTPQVAIGRTMEREVKSNVDSTFYSTYTYDDFTYAGPNYRMRATAFYSLPGREETLVTRSQESPFEVACAPQALCRTTNNNQCPPSTYLVSHIKPCFGTQLCCSSVQSPATSFPNEPTP